MGRQFAIQERYAGEPDSPWSMVRQGNGILLYDHLTAAQEAIGGYRAMDTFVSVEYRIVMSDDATREADWKEWTE